MRLAISLLLLCAAAFTGSSARGDGDMKQGTLLKAGENSELWCKTCGVFVSIFDKVMSNQEVQQFLDGLLEKSLCPRLPASVEPECEKDIPQIVPAVISFLESLADSRLCTGMGVCKEESLREMIVKEKMVNVLKVRNTETCDMCHKFTETLEEKIVEINPQTVEQYKQTLIQACANLGALQDKCAAFVERNSYLLLYYVMKEKSEGNILKICAELSVCEPSMDVLSVPPLPLSLVKQMGKMSAKANASDKCMRCREIAAKGVKGISDPEFKQEVHDYIAHLCSYAPPIRERCTESLTEMSTKVLDFLSDNFQPDGVCEKLGLCGDGEVPQKLQNALDMKTKAPKATYIS